MLRQVLDTGICDITGMNHGIFHQSVKECVFVFVFSENMSHIFNNTIVAEIML